MVRSAGTLNYYLDGVKYGAGSGMGITNVSNSYVTLGCFSWNNPSGFMNGSVSNLRMVQGTALYTANFTPPTQQLTAISGTTFLTYQSPTIIDNSTNAITITNFNGVTVENPLTWNTVKRELFDGKFQTFRDIDEYTIPNSVYATQFNGSSQYLLLADNAAFQFGTGNFTIEAWVYLTTVNSTQRRSYGYQATGSTVCWVGVSTTNKFSAELRGVGAVNGVQVYSTTTPLINTWYHLAFVRSGTTTYLFVNGVLETTTTSMNQNIASGGTPSIGAYNIGGSLGDYWPGFISNLRVVKGTALYTSTFTPSLSPLTAITGTSLLTCQNPTIIDNSTNALTITNNGTATTTAISSGASFIQTKSKLFSNGVFQVSSSFNEVVIPIEYLAVAGGGGGGTGWGGGGGAGGMIVSTANLVASSVYTIIVGAGGGTISSGASREFFVSGSNTTITGTDVSIVAYGGGYGGVTSTAGSNGGSGGGGSGTNNGVGGSAAGKGVYPGSVYISATRQGYDGTTNGAAGGGGGGAGGAGSGSNGGSGLASTLSITGTSVTYAGGGAGYNTGSGGSGGGGGVATSGTANLGGGGGADNGTTVGLGGSGVVVIRYPNTYPDPISLTGSPIANNTGGYKIYKFNSSGTITF
jgi:hypothetical protein